MNEELIRLAADAIEKGADPGEVYARMVEMGAFPNAFAARMAVESHQDASRAELLERVADRGAVANVAGLAANAATFGLLDDVLELFGADEAAESFRTGVREAREADPTAAFITEAAAGSLVPAFGALRVTRGATPLARALARVGAASGGGAAAGGLFGFGEAEGELSTRLAAGTEGAVFGGLIGGLTGGALSAAGTASRRLGELGRRAFGGGRAQRVARELVERTGLPALPDDVRAIAERSDQLVQNVRARHFRPLERRFQRVETPEIAQVLREIREHPDALTVLRRVSREVAQGQRAPSFRELQELQQLLQDAGRPEAGTLTNAMTREIPGFAQANAAYRRVIGPREALEVGLGFRLDGRSRTPTIRGRAFRTNTALQLERTLQSIPPELQRPFLIGRLHREVQRLQTGNGGRTLRALLEMAPEAERLFSQFFPTPEAFAEFRRVLQTERSSERIAAAFRRYARPALVGGGLLTGAALEALGVTDFFGD